MIVDKVLKLTVPALLAIISIGIFFKNCVYGFEFRITETTAGMPR
jgi:hypothetical protein